MTDWGRAEKAAAKGGRAMEIAVARREDFERVMEFYYDLIDSMQDAEFHPAWEKDIYPTRAFVRDSIENQELLFASIDGIIVGAMVLNCSGADGYGCAKLHIVS